MLFLFLPNGIVMVIHFTGPLARQFFWLYSITFYHNILFSICAGDLQRFVCLLWTHWLRRFIQKISVDDTIQFLINTEYFRISILVIHTNIWTSTNWLFDDDRNLVDGFKYNLLQLFINDVCEWKMRSLF